MKLSDNDTAYFFQLETSLHKRQIRNCADATSALLANDFVEFGSSGKVWDKSSIIASMQTETMDEPITVEDFEARELASDVVLHIHKQPQQESCRRPITSLQLTKLHLEAAQRKMADDFSSGNKNPGFSNLEPVWKSIDQL